MAACRYLSKEGAVLSESHLKAKIHCGGVKQSQQASQEHHNGLV